MGLCAHYLALGTFPFSCTEIHIFIFFIILFNFNILHFSLVWRPKPRLGKKMDQIMNWLVTSWFIFQAVEVDDVLASNQTQKEQVIHIDHESFYEGRVFGELQSRATVHLEDGLLTAKIETPQDIYHIGKGMNTHLRPFIFTFLVLFPKAKLLKQIGHFLIVNSKIAVFTSWNFLSFGKKIV